MEDKKTSKNLIFFTSTFPYGNGETFIESEINYLSSHFNKIIVFPEKKDQHIREMPANCELVELKNYKVPWFGFFKVLLSEKLIFREVLDNIFINPRRNRILLGFLKAAIVRKQQIQDVLFLLNQGSTVLYSYWLGESALAISLLNGNFKRISRIHGWDVYKERHPFHYLPLRPFLNKNLDRIYSISEHAKNYFSSNFSEIGTIEVSKLGVDGGKDTSLTSDLFRKMISISNLKSLKRVDFIGSIYTKFLKGELEWSHIGGGKGFEKFQRQYGAEIFLGEKSNSDVHVFLEANYKDSFLINLSEFEGIPVSMMEAMSYGIPCIGTDVGGVSEIIKDGENGFLLPANPSPQMVVESIKKLLMLDGETAKKMRENARKTWEEKFLARKNFNQFAKEISSL